METDSSCKQALFTGNRERGRGRRRERGRERGRGRDRGGEIEGER